MTAIDFSQRQSFVPAARACARNRTVLPLVAMAALSVLACASSSAPTPPMAPTARTATLPPRSETRTGAGSGEANAAAPEAIAERHVPDAEFRQQPPQPAADPAFKVPKVQRFKLASGLPVILASDSTLPLVYVQLVVRTGSLADPVGKAGLADLAADMLDEGTTNRSALQISADIEQVGATLSTEAAWDYTTVSVSGLTEVMDRALPVWADVVLNPGFSEQELSRVREIRMAGLQRRKDSPPALAGIAFGRAVFGEAHPLGWPQDGTQSTLPQLTPADLKAFHAAYFKPNNAVLVVAGDLDEAGVRKLVEPLLKGWRGQAKPQRPVPVAKPLAKTRIFLVDKAQAPQSSIRMGLAALPRKHPDYYKARVMNEVLGGSFRRLSLNLREQKGWTYGVYSRFTPHVVPGSWQVAGEFVADKTADSVTEVLNEIKRLRDEDVPSAELQEAKDSLVRAFPASFATMRQVAGQMAALFIYNLPENELAAYQNKVGAVTVKDVRQMARKYLLPERLAVVVVGDQDTVQAPLSKLGEVELRDLNGDPVAAKP